MICGRYLKINTCSHFVPYKPSGTGVINTCNVHFQMFIVSYKLCHILHTCITHCIFSITIRKENAHVHTEGSSSSVWRVRGQVPPKFTCLFALFYASHQALKHNASRNPIGIHSYRNIPSKWFVVDNSKSIFVHILYLSSPLGHEL
jgi:hypothetical protein